MSFPVVVPDWAIYAGDAFSQTYKIEVGGVTTDLRSWTLWKASWRPYQGSNVISLSVNTADLIDGTVTISATDEQTRLMDGPGMWDVQAKQSSSTRTWLRGKSMFTEDVAL
jgi:hypothetical protein